MRASEKLPSREFIARPAGCSELEGTDDERHALDDSATRTALSEERIASTMWMRKRFSLSENFTGWDENGEENHGESVRCRKHFNCSKAKGQLWRKDGSNNYNAKQNDKIQAASHLSDRPPMILTSEHDSTHTLLAEGDLWAIE